MITIKLKDETIKKFNMPSFEREKSFKNAWYSIHGDEKYDNKSFKIQTETETLNYKINDIIECDFEEVLHLNNN